MNGVLFLPQTTLDQWLDQGQVDMGNDSLIFTQDRSELPSVPAIKFSKVVAGTDTHKLVGKVKSTEAMRMGGAEISMGAVIMGEVAYETEDGFMLTVQMVQPGVKSNTQGRMAAAPKGKEADLLAQFILDKLS